MSDKPGIQPLEYRNPYRDPPPLRLVQVLVGLLWGVVFVFMALMLLFVTVLAFGLVTERMNAAERLVSVIIGVGAVAAMAAITVKAFQMMTRQFKPQERDWE